MFLKVLESSPSHRPFSPLLLDCHHVLAREERPSVVLHRLENSAGAVGEVRPVEGMWGGEILHGLGITGVPASEGASVDPREEELRGILERERVRLTKDIKTTAASNISRIDTIAGAFQD